MQSCIHLAKKISSQKTEKVKINLIIKGKLLRKQILFFAVNKRIEENLEKFFLKRKIYLAFFCGFCGDLFRLLTGH
jgi:hypothetical protein